MIQPCKLTLDHGRLSEFVLYETQAQYLLVGNDKAASRFRILRISRGDGDLVARDDGADYTRAECHHAVEALHRAHANTGGVTKVADVYGLVGFVRFLEGYYLIAITKRGPVAYIGGHEIFSIDDTLFISIARPKDKDGREIVVPIPDVRIPYAAPGEAEHRDPENGGSGSGNNSNSNSNNNNSGSSGSADPGSRAQQPVAQPVSSSTSSSENSKHRATAEAKYRSLFAGVRLTRDFYFSPTYDMTHSLQYHMCAGANRPHAGTDNAGGHAGTDDEPSAHQQQQQPTGLGVYQEMFVWNHYLLSDFAESRDAEHWLTPIIHGYVSQQRLNVMGRQVDLTLIARRSRFFAGTRFLKRGCNDLGDVANDVETEQIVHETTSDTARLGHYSSVVQVRGSIPLFWKQEGGLTHPKPDIVVTRFDPYYTATRLHFENMFRRYGAPIHIFNLVKAKEKVPREMILREAFGEAVTFLNHFLPPAAKLQYMAWDMHRASKVDGEDVLTILSDMARIVLARTGFFHTGREARDGLRGGSIQCGVLRTNCIDCLDRTNLAQYALGRVALGFQLHELGALASPTLPDDVSTTTVGNSNSSSSSSSNSSSNSNSNSNSNSSSHGGSGHDPSPAAAAAAGGANTSDGANANANADASATAGDQASSFNSSSSAGGGHATSGAQPAAGSSIAVLLRRMYDSMGDRLAMQYAGSHVIPSSLKNEKGQQSKTIHGRAILTSIRRFYSNSFTDAEKQDAMNVFLGYFEPRRERLDIWALEDDYFLHSEDTPPTGDAAADWYTAPLDEFARGNFPGYAARERDRELRRRRSRRGESGGDEGHADGDRSHAAGHHGGAQGPKASAAAAAAPAAPATTRVIESLGKRGRRATMHCLSVPLDEIMRAAADSKIDGSGGVGDDTKADVADTVDGDHDGDHDGDQAAAGGDKAAVDVDGAQPGGGQQRAGWFDQIYKPQEMVFFDELLERPYNRSTAVSTIGPTSRDDIDRPGERSAETLRVRRMLRHATERFGDFADPDLLQRRAAAAAAADEAGGGGDGLVGQLTEQLRRHQERVENHNRSGGSAALAAPPSPGGVALTVTRCVSAVFFFVCLFVCLFFWGGRVLGFSCMFQV
jgi:hypothetical protein